jgi:molybdate transport system regulatory protein
MTKTRTAWQVRPRWRIVDRSTIALGPGKVDLLAAIERYGSISSAGRELGMSYRRAWMLVETMNRTFRSPLVATSGWRGKGASLTVDGRRVLALYRELETRSIAAGKRPVASLRRLLIPPGPNRD